jgi:hypothetical protein
MSEPATAPSAEPTIVEVPPVEAKPKLLSKLEIGVFLSVVVGMQCALAYFFLPAGTPAVVTSAAGHEEVAKTQARAEEPKAEVDELHGEQMEVDLGQFSLTSFDPTSNRTLLIDFHLYGTVISEHKDGEGEPAEGGGHGGHGAKKGEAPDPMANTKFGKLYKKNKIRARDQVLTIIRNAEMADLADPGLGLIKRQILAKTNALLGEPLLKGVIFSDFAVVEQ